MPSLLRRLLTLLSYRILPVPSSLPSCLPPVLLPLVCLWARPAITPMPTGRACTRMRASWTFLARGRECSRA